MTEASAVTEEIWRSWAFPAGALLAAMLAATWVTYLGWRYVPYHLSLLAEAQASLPLSARWAVAASQWIVRLLPFLVVSLFLVGPALLAGLLAALARWPSQRVARVTGVALLCLAVAEGVLCGVMLYGMHSANAAIAN